MSMTNDDPFCLIERSIASRSPDTKRKKSLRVKSKRSVTRQITQESHTTEPLDTELKSFFQASTGLAKEEPKSSRRQQREGEPMKATLTSSMPKEAITVNPKSSDLSELAQQLRLLQTKNDAQRIQMARLERQLQIAAELSNSSVDDVRAALQAACYAHVSVEVQATMASLRNQVQLAQLQLQQAKQESLPTASHITRVADLQLRIGELEEGEMQQKQELEVLYRDLREQSASWIRLKAQYEEQQVQLEEYRRREQPSTATEMNKQEQVDLEADIVDTGDDATVEKDAEEIENDDDMQEEEQRLVVSEQLLREELELASNFGQLLSSPRQSVDVEEQVEQGQLAIREKQWEEAEKALKLKQAQLKARNFVLEENLQDLEQQLSSLYTAFNITSQDLDQEQQARRALESNLHAADERVAQYIDDAAEADSTGSPHTASVVPVAPYAVTARATPASPARVSPSTPPRPYPPGYAGSVSPSRPLQPLSASPRRTAYSPIRSSHPQGELLLEGHLLFRMTGLRKAWKEKYVALYLSSTHFHLMVSNVGDRLNCKTYSAPAGSAELRMYHKHTYGFTLMIAPGEMSGTVLYLAATDENEFVKWINALGSVSSHPDDGQGDRLDESTSSWPATNNDTDSQEAADLERALWLSTHEEHAVGYDDRTTNHQGERTGMVFS